MGLLRYHSMPELPEVETNARNLAQWAVGKTIVAAAPPPGIPPAAFRKRVEGKKIKAVFRRGKWILVALEPDAGLGLHLGMTGKLAITPDAADLPRFTRGWFRLSSRRTLCFVDSRRFGRVIAEPSFADLAWRPEIAAVGPDALGEVTPAILSAALARTGRAIKEALLDQTLIGGVGNIYAAEALWRAGIDPRTPARRIAADPERNRTLWRAIRAALRHGLSTFTPGQLPEYIEEGADNPFHVYDRGGEPCHRCGATLCAITQGGRTTVFCATCQKKT
jgi:formamidopyrimidine-DNA glycosylase